MTGELKTFPNSPLQSQVRPSPVAIVVLLVFILAGFPYLSVDIARISLELSNSAQWLRLPLWAVAALMICIPVWLASVILRRKLMTGHFLLNRSESAARRAEMQEKMGAGKPFWPQASLWALPVILSLFFLALSVLAIAGAASFGPSSTKPFVALLALAALFLFIPLQMVFKTVRRHLKTGSYLPSEEEMVATRLRVKTPLPLWLRILMAVVMLLNAILQTVPGISRFFGAHGSLGHSPAAACFFWGLSFYWIRQVIRLQRSAITAPPLGS